MNLETKPFERYKGDLTLIMVVYVDVSVLSSDDSSRLPSNPPSTPTQTVSVLTPVSRLTIDTARLQITHPQSLSCIRFGHYILLSLFTFNLLHTFTKLEVTYEA